MTERSLTPNITVTIGHHTRIYFAFVTTAPTELDSPATVTLHAATFADVVSFAAEPITLDSTRGRGTGAPGARRCDGARLATSQVPRPSAPAAVGGSRARRPQHAAALALATASGPSNQPGRGMTRSLTRQRQPLAEEASFSGGHIMVVKIVPNDKANPPGKLADAELHFTDGVLDGLKLIGFAVWERRSGSGRNVTFPARQYRVNGERRSFALLRPIADAASQERVRDLVLQAYAEYEEGTEAAS